MLQINKENYIQLIGGFQVASIVLTVRAVLFWYSYPTLIGQPLYAYMLLIQFIVCVVMNFVYIAITIYLSCKEFGWKMLNTVGTDRNLQRKFANYQVLDTFVTTDFQLNLCFLIVCSRCYTTNTFCSSLAITFCTIRASFCGKSLSTR